MATFTKRLCLCSNRKLYAWIRH